MKRSMSAWGVIKENQNSSIVTVSARRGFAKNVGLSVKIVRKYFVKAA